MWWCGFEVVGKEKIIVTVPTMVTIQEASDLTHINYHALWKMCKTNKIVHIKCGNRYLINMEKLVEFLNQGIQEVG